MKKDGLGRFCDRSCVAKYKHEQSNNNGKNNPNYKGKLDYIKKLKKEGECNRCGEERDPALCFHHKDDCNKVESVSRMAYELDYSLKELKKEVKKCELICFNCHQIIHSKK